MDRASSRKATRLGLAIAAWLRRPWRIDRFIRQLVAILRAEAAPVMRPKEPPFEPPFPQIGADHVVTGPSEIRWINSVVRAHTGEPNPICVIGSERFTRALASAFPVITCRPDNWRVVCDTADPVALMVESTRNDASTAWRYRLASYPHGVSVGSRDIEAITSWFEARGAPTIFAYTDERRNLPRYEGAARHFRVVWCASQQQADVFARLGLKPDAWFVAPAATTPPAAEAMDRRRNILVLVDTEQVSEGRYEAAVGKLISLGLDHEEVLVGPQLIGESRGWESRRLVTRDFDVARIAGQYDKCLVLTGQSPAESGWVFDSLAVGTPVLSFQSSDREIFPRDAVVPLGAGISTPTPQTTRDELREYVATEHTYEHRLKAILLSIGADETVEALFRNVRSRR